MAKRFEAIVADAKTAPAKLRELPADAQAGFTTVLGQAEETYEDLAGRGKDLVERIRSQKATEDLVAQREDHGEQGQGDPHHRQEDRRHRDPQRQGDHDQRPQDREDRRQGRRPPPPTRSATDGNEQPTFWVNPLAGRPSLSRWAARSVG